MEGDPASETYLYAGYYAGSNGDIELDDPDTEIQLYAGTAIIGSGGVGSLRVQNQAAVYSGWGYIGDSSTGIGNVDLVGPGSKWELAYNMTIGYEGQGFVNVLQGARLSCNFLSLGAYPGSYGALTVSDPGSVCQVERDMLVGGWMDSDNEVLTRDDWNNGGSAGLGSKTPRI